MSPERPQRRTRRRRPLLGAVAVVVLVLVAAVGARHFRVQTFWVPSASMTPTLHEGDVLAVDRTDRGTARRGEIVVFDGTGYFGDGEDSSGRFWVKRVIGIGGDRVTCCDDAGRITINGDALDEPYLAPGTAASAVDFDVEVPDGAMFVLGDDRAHSSDSRDRLGSPGGGMVPTRRVVGEVERILWPLERSGPLAPIGSRR